jgi:CubicO group peptidase (beta-lactamase class C family)
MKLRNKIILGAAGSFAVALGILRVETGPDIWQFIAHMPTDRNVLYWSQATRDVVFRHLEWVPTIKSHDIAKGAQVHGFAQGAPLNLQGFDFAGFMQHQHAMGVIVVQDGKVRLEQYGNGETHDSRWTSFSVSKSVASTLIGAAIKDGFIKSVDQMVTDFIPEFKGTAYDGVSIKQILTMTSGLKWNENYSDPNSDVAQFDKVKIQPNEEAIVTYMKKLPREAAPGTKWVYKTGETSLIGVIVMRATHKSLAQYLSEKIWAPYGMEQNGLWVLDTTGREIAGCCLSATLGDYARFGQFIMDGGMANGQQVLPDGWIEAATHKQADIAHEGRGYGYQWWTYDDGSYAAVGHFGQGIFIDPKRHLIIAQHSDYPENKEGDRQEERLSFYRRVQALIDKEQVH